MCGKQDGSCITQGPRRHHPNPGGSSGAPQNYTRPSDTVSAAHVARHKRPGPRPSRGISCVSSVPPAPHLSLPHHQVQDWTPAACLPSTTCSCPGISASPGRHWLRPPPASGPGQGFAFAARKKAGGSRVSGRGPPKSKGCTPGTSSSNHRCTLPGQEPQVCRSSITKIQPVPQASTSGTKTGHCLPKAQASSRPKEVYSPKAILIQEQRRPPGAPPPNPTLPTRTSQVLGSHRDTLKGWLTGGQVCAPALNPGNPLWSLLSPG